MSDLLIDVGETIPVVQSPIPDCEIWVVCAYYVPRGQWDLPRQGSSAPTPYSQDAAEVFARDLPRGWIKPFLCKITNPRAIEGSKRDP